MNEQCTARPIGRVLRLLCGLGLTFVAGRYLIGVTPSLYLQVLAAMVGLLVFYSLVHVFLSKAVSSLHHCFGAAVALGPVLLVYFLGGATGQLSALLYIGVSLLVAAARADAGCEVTSIPGLVFGGNTHLACIAFSPIDWIEERLARTGDEGTESSSA